MSLINDALKRAEKSLNKNSSNEQREKIPSFDFESSKKNNKLFFITLLGGTFFFAVLILLIILLRSPSEHSPKPPLQNTPILASIIPEIQAKTEILKIKEDLQDLNDFENNSKTSINKDLNSDLFTQDDLSTPEPSEAEEGKQSLNNELFGELVGFASKAFTGSSKKEPIKETTPQEIASPQEKTKENYSLSTAQETLNMLEEESINNKKLNTPKDPIEEFIQDLSITGVMIANNESKILINNQVYSNNSMINSPLGLKLINISPHYIILKDLKGETHKREF